MAWRMETASGLRLYATDRRLRLGQHYGALEFLDPCVVQAENIYSVELLFDNKTTAKYYRLNNNSLHFSLSHFKIVPKSLFLHEIEIDPNTQYANRYMIVTKDPYWEKVFEQPNMTLYAGG
jgi:hypothetical protein